MQASAPTKQRLLRPSTMRPCKRPRANDVRPYRTCVLICRGRRPRRPGRADATHRPAASVTRLSHNFPTFFKFRSFSFHIRRVYCKCSQEGSRDPERERDPKFFHPYSSFLLTPGRCRKIPAPLWCFLVQFAVFWYNACNLTGYTLL